MIRQEFEHEIVRIWSDSLYDHQEVRKASNNRVRCLVRRRLKDLGYNVEETGEDKEEWKDEDLNDALCKAKEDGKISEEEADILEDALSLAEQEEMIEKAYEKRVEPLIKEEPVFKYWLDYVRGISTRNTSRLLKYFGYCDTKDKEGKDLCPSISSLWKYAGLAPVNGKAEKRTKNHKLSYNLKIKTGILGVVADSLMKQSPSYKQIYDEYKARIMERGCCEALYQGKDAKKKGKPCKNFPGHAHRMALRKMAKLFLAHYWVVCRTLKEQPVSTPYSIGMLKHEHHLQPLFDKKPNNEHKKVYEKFYVE